MMEDSLQLGYALILSCSEKGDMNGGYMRKGKGGISYYPLTGEEETLIGIFPNVLNSLQEGLTLQAYYCRSGMTALMLGKRTYEENHGCECLEQPMLAYSNDFVSALVDLDSTLENSAQKPAVYRKAYRLFDNDRYQFYTEQFIRENNLEG